MLNHKGNKDRGPVISTPKDFYLEGLQAEGWMETSTTPRDLQVKVCLYHAVTAYTFTEENSRQRSEQ